jgi:hypothetical protein
MTIAVRKNSPNITRSGDVCRCSMLAARLLEVAAKHNDPQVICEVAEGTFAPIAAVSEVRNDATEVVEYISLILAMDDTRQL